MNLPCKQLLIFDQNVSFLQWGLYIIFPILDTPILERGGMTGGTHDSQAGLSTLPHVHPPPQCLVGLRIICFDLFVTNLILGESVVESIEKALFELQFDLSWTWKSLTFVKMWLCSFWLHILFNTGIVYDMLYKSSDKEFSQ